ncbi:transposable element Tcb2 transposase [Trichonephila clavipes]|nr:transposable element Tcb2 transposase [Trichonephila clavipes]
MLGHRISYRADTVVSTPLAMVQDSESDDFSDNDHEEVDIANSGSDSSVCSLIEDNCSLIETVYYVWSRKSNSRDNKVLLFTAVMRPILAYGCPVWGYAAKTNINILDTLQNSTIRMIKGKSCREIVKIVGRSHSCVQKIIGRFKSDGLIENKSGRGRKSILSDVAKRKVLKDIKIAPKLSVVKLAAKTSRIMGRSKKRLKFAKTHQLKTDNFWKKVIFSDESKFNIFGSDGRRTVWRKPNTALDPKNLRPTVKHGGGSVMVWGCMASNGVGNLVFIDGIMDHKLYIDILNNNLKESAKKLGLDGNFIFQQDNDHKHTARNVKMWRLFHCK